MATMEKSNQTKKLEDAILTCIEIGDLKQLVILLDHFGVECSEDGENVYQCWAKWVPGLPKFTLFLWSKNGEIFSQEYYTVVSQVTTEQIFEQILELMDTVTGNPSHAKTLTDLKHRLETYAQGTGLQGDDLPVFDGTECHLPGEIVWSWDLNHALVGADFSELRIIEREKTNPNFKNTKVIL